MSGAPDIITNPFQNKVISDPATDIIAKTLRSKTIVQQIPVWEPAVQFSVPPTMYNRGWVAPDVPTVAGPTYPTPVQAPEVVYINKSYSKLIQNSATQQPNPNRQAVQLTAPSISTIYGS